MSAKQAYLMSKARVVPFVALPSAYDEKEQLNVCTDGGAVVLREALVRTESKTLSAPGDDDPDAEAEGCY